MILADLPSWFTGFNFLVALFGILVTVGAAYLVIIARSRTDVSGLQTDRAIAAEAILKVRDSELETCKCRLKDTETELEELTAEHRTLVGLTIGELLEFWRQKEDIEAQMLRDQRRIRILEKAGDA